MNGYHKLSKIEILNLQQQLVLPQKEYPHYKPLGPHPDDKPYKEVYILPYLKVEVNEYGDIKYDGKKLEPFNDGPFLHCAKVYIKDYGIMNVYELVKLAFDPIPDRELYEIHHINNNALDNRPENLIYVTKEEHQLIDSEFNKKLKLISSEITKKNKKDIIELFTKNYERSFNGSELYNIFKNTYRPRIKYNIESLCKEKFLIRIENNTDFEFQKFILNGKYNEQLK